MGVLEGLSLFLDRVFAPINSLFSGPPSGAPGIVDKAPNYEEKTVLKPISELDFPGLVFNPPPFSSPSETGPVMENFEKKTEEIQRDAI